MNTIYALASGRPPAAIAVVRVSGSHAHEAARQLAGGLPAPRQAALRTFRGADGAIIDRGLLLRFNGPASSTGEDVVEFHIHGGRAVADALLGALAALGGLRAAAPGEFTRRAFENGRIDLTEAEGLADLIEAETESQRRAALGLAEGGLRRQIEQWQQQLLGLSARAEAAIDYVDEHDEGVGVDPALAGECGALARELGEWLASPRAEPLREGVRVVIAGPPNVGKSSLLNAIAGYDRAIVTPLPGTTRDQIDVPLAFEGLPLLLTDTAGVRETGDPVEKIGVERSRAAIAQADMLLWLGNPGEAPGHHALLLVHSRADLAERAIVPDGSIAVSSLTDNGLPQLLLRITELARGLLPAEGMIALNRRQAAELADAFAGLEAAGEAGDIVLAAEHLRHARAAFDRLTGRAGIEDVLDALFGRFCLGK